MSTSEEDMLVKSLLGRFNDNKIRTSTHISRYGEIDKLSDSEYKRFLHSRMREDLAAYLIDHRRVSTEQLDTADGDVQIKMTAWVFSRQAVTDLIVDSFRAGMEAAAEKA